MYAKSQPVETIMEHTQALLTNYDVLREKYPDLLTDRQWLLLKIAVQYHDAGKVYSRFQNMIRKQLGLSLLPCSVDHDIPHNFLSPLFVPIKKLRKEVGLSVEEERVLLQAIAYHHERNKDIRQLKDAILEVINQDLHPNMKDIQSCLDMPLPERLSTLQLAKVNKQIDYRDANYLDYVLIKGLLLRLDHAASAHEPIELHSSYDVSEYVNSYLKEKEGLRPLQVFTQENQDRNLVLIGQTGMGKTEAALLWLGKGKGFFTLPLRVSLNALYERTKDVKKIAYVDANQRPIAGLLHSNALDFLFKNQEDSEENEQSLHDLEQSYQQSRLLSRKLTFSTIDQILTFPFYFKGHEKWLATLSYSKLVIDEIQAYSPRIAAVLLKGIQRIHQLGGKFLIMTATMPTFFLEKMNEMGLSLGGDYLYETFTNDLIRHRISVEENSLLDAVEDIVDKGKRKKVLVICNTVKQSIKMYEALKDQGVSSHLLHSQFTLGDRAALEKKILTFAPNDCMRNQESGIWITTQVVEASIDVDFDVLYTELSVLDSLFQRMGRCYRSRSYSGLEANVYVYTQNVSGIGANAVYHPELFQLSKEFLLPYHGQFLSEEEKVNLVAEMYKTERLQQTAYYREFEKALKILEHPPANEIGRNEAHQIMREVDRVQVIPRQKCDELWPQFEKYDELKRLEYQARKQKDWDRLKKYKVEKRQIYFEIEQQVISIPRYLAKNKVSPLPSNIRHLYMYDCQYDFDSSRVAGKGVVYDEYDPFL